MKSIELPGGATVERGESHPDNYLWIIVGGRRFFLGVRTPGMTRADVKRMALRHPQLEDRRNRGH